jgi:monoterpene epsilon-lactone hydrolase
MKAATDHVVIQSLLVRVASGQLSRRGFISGSMAAAALAACRSPPHGERAIATQENQVSNSVKEFNYIVIHPLDAEDAAPMSALRAMVKPMKGMARGIEARAPFDAVMERVQPRNDVTFEADTVGGIHGLWVRPADSRPDEVILHLHGGWFNLGTANAYRNLVAQVAARVRVAAFVPDYRLAPEHPFPAAPDDVLACYRGLDGRGFRRTAITGDSAGGDLALVLASRVTAKDFSAKATLVGVAAMSPVTDLSLSGETYVTRAEADPFFTRSQVLELVQAYLGGADPKDPLASPLHARLSGLPAIRIDVGDDEVLLDDSRRYVERAVAAGVDARLHVWMGMPHGFPSSVGMVKASTRALDAMGTFLAARFEASR